MQRVLPYRRSTGEPVSPPRPLRRWGLLAILAAGTMGAAAIIAGSWLPEVLETLALNLIWVLAVLVPAAMLGLLITPQLARRRVFADSGWPDGFELVLATGLGLGILSLATMLLGTFRGLYIGIPVVLLAAAVIGFLPARNFLRHLDRSVFTRDISWREIKVLGACFPLAVLLIATTFPVGTLWTSEGRGYDVMEYHLQLPREYLEANSTAPNSHNVYSFLPANMEMLYLIQMRLTHFIASRDDTSSHLLALYPAQMLHAVVTLLAAAAIALAPIRMIPVARVIAFLLVIATPWTLVVGSLAYNDGAVLLYGALALALMLGPPGRSVSVMAGILLGLAVGCKLTAGLLLAVPIAGMLLSQRRWRGAITAGVIALAVYSPWALRAMVRTHTPGHWGNPVFPLFAKQLGSGHWTPEQVERWNRGHQPAAAYQSASGHVRALAKESVLNAQWSPSWASVYQWFHPKEPFLEANWSHFGWLSFMLPLVLLAAPLRGPPAGRLILCLLLQVAGWLFFTHLQARFLLPAVLPLALLFALAVDAVPRISRLLGIWVTVQAVLAVFILLPEARLLCGPIDKDQPCPIGAYFRLPDQWVIPPDPRMSKIFPENVKTVLVGNACPLYVHGRVRYHTVFDASRLANYMTENGPEKTMAWMAQREVDLVVVDWSEITRLRKTYGFDDRITPEFFAELERHGLRRAPHTPAFRSMVLYEVPKGTERAVQVAP